MVYNMMSHTEESLLVSRQIVFHFVALELPGRIFPGGGHLRRISLLALFIYLTLRISDFSKV